MTRVTNTTKTTDKSFNQFMQLMGKTNFKDNKKSDDDDDAVDTENPEESDASDSESDSEKKARRKNPKFGLKGVAGMKDLKAQMKRDFIDIFANRELAEAYGIKPAPMMLYGAPGTGKTYIVKKLAEEIDMHFMSISPDNIASTYIHGTQQKIGKVFKKAISNAPTLLFMDEFDAMVPQRTNNEDNLSENGEVCEFLTQMNDLADKGVYLIAATNHPESIDRAVMRSGRIDNLVYVSLPDEEAREELFRMEMKGRPAEKKLSYKKLVEMTKNYTASDISSIVRTAARETFEEAKASKSKKPLPIRQETLERIIRQKPSSVSERDIRFYEKLREEFSPNDTTAKKKGIGFV